MVEQFIEELFQIEGPRQMLGDFQHHLEFLSGILTEQALAAGVGIDLFADDQFIVRAAGGGRFPEREQIGPDLERVLLRQGRPPAQLRPVEEGAVAAVQIFHHIAAVLEEDAGMVTANRLGLQDNVGVGLTADDGGFRLQRKMAAGVRSS